MGGTERVSALKGDYHALQQLNADICTYAGTLARMLAEREDILNRNSFIVDRPTGVPELIALAGETRPVYRVYLHAPLDALSCQFDGKYWPPLQDLLSVIAAKRPAVEFMARSEEVMVEVSRGSIAPDYFRELFCRLQMIREERRLPARFTLSDSQLASLATVSLDLPDPLTAENVKTIRNRLYEAGTPGVWKKNEPTIPLK